MCDINKTRRQIATQYFKSWLANQTIKYDFLFYWIIWCIWYFKIKSCSISFIDICGCGIEISAWRGEIASDIGGVNVLTVWDISIWLACEIPHRYDWAFIFAIIIANKSDWLRLNGVVVTTDGKVCVGTSVCGIKNGIVDVVSWNSGAFLRSCWTKFEFVSLIMGPVWIEQESIKVIIK